MTHRALFVRQMEGAAVMGMTLEMNSAITFKDRRVEQIAALYNAIFNATGKRVRALPLGDQLQA